jgi:hypothetical protein
MIKIWGNKKKTIINDKIENKNKTKKKFQSPLTFQIAWIK